MKLTRPSRLRFMAAALFAFALAVGCGRQPQLGNSEQAFKSADALWTAVCAKQPKLVDDAHSRLKQLHADGELSDGAFAVLDDVVSKANASDWSAAQKQLKQFWRGQRLSHGS